MASTLPGTACSLSCRTATQALAAAWHHTRHSSQHSLSCRHRHRHLQLSGMCAAATHPSSSCPELLRHADRTSQHRMVVVSSCPGRISLVYSLLHRWPCRLRYSAPNTGTVVSLLAAQCLGTRHPAQWRWYTHDLSPSADSRFWSLPFAFVLVLMFRGSSPIAVVPPHAELVCVAVRVVASSPW